ncbi:6-pyruvoyl tetrahydropterin synthase family protein [Streptomonospora nanhaiensis]|uniref:6-carboxy-5,6,7,8-tetrahydropterin synthase n=1 Tax=Streptomonospora nanhaiensis TaxID=1323731 RepID=A0A853BW29_9ACTN|nr:6-carboxytetrahydropterin synthase [Streptomonospora nanhaiensis]MBV2365563.1 6-carboxytetrahydropterin synthase [Streptomonospora nanhaiensis]MBX9387117.1 6-carboxytetrahydropterin synthase [Streptomonospora nanhaiensis]NYI98945.1 6-pyruvoyltetrahydropterin/6-carboxytetrahydropterin synthase [Streptomonospora nanhaiensis]
METTGPGAGAAAAPAPAPPAATARPAAEHAVAVRHNFETAHRLPHLAGKCENLHGHSWWAEVTVTAPRLAEGTVVEFGSFKAGLRSWIDTQLDHGAMLGSADPLAKLLPDHGCKVFRFGAADPRPAERFARDLAYPTVEAVAELVARVAADLLAALPCAPGARVSAVCVSETHVNTAQWRETAR